MNKIFLETFRFLRNIKEKLEKLRYACVERRLLLPCRYKYKNSQKILQVSEIAVKSQANLRNARKVHMTSYSEDVVRV